MSAGHEHFECDESGYVRHWLLCGPSTAPYEGPAGSDDQMRAAAIDEHVADPPKDACIGAEGPLGLPWRFHYPGENIFVEQSAFYHHLESLNLWASTCVEVPEETTFDAWLWASGTADLYAGSAHLVRHDSPRYMYPARAPVRLTLPAGASRLYVRLQGLGVRDTRFLFGLQLTDRPSAPAIRIPGPDGITEKLVEAERWLNGVRAVGGSELAADAAPPVRVSLKLLSSSAGWPEGQSRMPLESDDALSGALSLEVEGQILAPTLDFPENHVIGIPAQRQLDDHRREHLKFLASRAAGSRGGALQVLARRHLGERLEGDAQLVEAAVERVAARGDCADFVLAALLRLHALGLLEPRETDAVRRTALGFRYWSDEPGTDAMCFGSENHSLLFHGCQYLAGLLFGDDSFTTTGRTGREQAAFGRDRCRAWLDRVEPAGFREFLSASYMPITTAALMNLVDLADDETIRRRAAGLVDAILRRVAMHAFDGVTTGPQGRVYRNVLGPHTGGTQALLSYATPEAVWAQSEWVAFVATSPGYEPPDDVPALMRAPASTTYRQAHVEITLEKKAGYALSSLAIPASFEATQAGEPQGGAGLLPGRPGYQQHVWHATLARDCHVFVNHPGATFDLSMSRPGYWYGNGSIPRTRQVGGTVCQIFNIPDEHPVRFTHAHWPASAFDAQQVRDHWAFGEKADGRVAVWSSSPLVPHSEVLTDRELRASGPRVAWVCVCAQQGEDADLAAFAARCEGMEPKFEPDRLVLSLAGGEGLSFKMPA